MQTKLIAYKCVLSLSVLAASLPSYAETPSNSELYEMIQEMQQEKATPKQVDEKPSNDVGYFVSYEYLSLKPSFNNSVAFNTEINGSDNNMFTTEYNWDNEDGSRVQFGGHIPDHGIGWRVSILDFDASVTESTVVPADGSNSEALFFDDPDIGIDGVSSTGESLSSTVTLELDAVDFEILFPVQYSKNKITYGVGLRHATLKHAANIGGFDSSGAFDEGIIIDNDFRGTGPVFSVELERPLFSDFFADNDWGLNIFTNAKVSYLFGSGDVDLILVDDAGNVDESLSFGRDGGMLGSEVQLGLELNYQPTDNFIFYSRVAGEGQYWDNAGGISANTAEGTDDEDQSNELKNSNMTLVGYSVVLGVQFDF